MKLLIALALAATFSLGWFAARGESAAPASSEADTCEVEVECLPDGTCRIECERPDGSSCWAVLACDGDGGCEVIESGGDCGDGAAGAADARDDCPEACIPASCCVAPSGTGD